MDDYKTEYLDYLLTDHWQGLRQASFIKHGKVCHACRSREKLQAHHLIYRHPLTNCTPDDILPLCESCHESLHSVPYVIQDTALRPNRAQRVAFVLRTLWKRFKIGKPQKKHKKKHKVERDNYRREILANPGRTLHVPTKGWRPYVAGEPKQIWEMPVKTRSAESLNAGI